MKGIVEKNSRTELKTTDIERYRKTMKQIK